MLPGRPNPLSIRCRAGRKAQRTPWFVRDKKSGPGEEAKKNSLKMNERSGNVFENKGSIFHRRERSGNVVEKKDTYASEA
jgi:hypothetical protein